MSVSFFCWCINVSRTSKPTMTMLQQASPVHNSYILDKLCASAFSISHLKHVDISDYILYKNGNAYTPFAYVYKDVSPLCSSHGNDGYGVFAARDLPKCTPVTFYAGKIYTEKHPHFKKHKSNYVYEFDDGVHMIDGLWQEPDGPWWTRHGIGHMLNDNIHVHASGLKCNAYFAEVQMFDVHTQQSIKRVVIVTTRDVARGEELLVSYSLGYWLHRVRNNEAGICAELGQSSGQWLCNMNALVEDFIDRMYRHGRKSTPTVVGDDELLCRELEMMTMDDDTSHSCGSRECYDTLPFIGEVKCVDMYENPKYCPTCEVYDYYFERDIREGAFDLIFAFDNRHDMVCCPWLNDASSSSDMEEDAIMDGEDIQTDAQVSCRKECRLTVYYILDTFNNTWLHTEVSCWKCGQNIQHLSFMA